MKRVVMPVRRQCAKCRRMVLWKSALSLVLALQLPAHLSAVALLVSQLFVIIS
ncbi:hypothetical protein ACLBOM_02880 [Escherichia coli]